MSQRFNWAVSSFLLRYHNYPLRSLNYPLNGKELRNLPHQASLPPREMLIGLLRALVGKKGKGEGKEH